MATFSFCFRKRNFHDIDKTNEILLRITHNRQASYIGTGIRVKENELKNGAVVKRRDREFLNTQLAVIYNKYFGTYNKLEYTEALTCSQIVALIKNDGATRFRTFSSLADEYIGTFTSDRVKSIKLYRLAANRFLNYCGEDIMLRNISPVKISNYVIALEKSGLSKTSVNIYTTLLKVIIKYAEKLNYIKFDVDPFIIAKVPVAKKRDTHITVDELRRIRDAEVSQRNVSVCRDIFMLTYYLAGMNLVDILAYDFRNTEDIDYVRKKTRNTKQGDNRVSFTIPDEAWPIIKKYMGKNGKLVFGRYSSYESCYNVLNRKMKDVAELGGVKHYFTLYSARKSFVQHGFDLGIPLSTLEYCIGQTMKDSRPIFNYVTIMKKHADEAIRRILDNLKA